MGSFKEICLAISKRTPTPLAPSFAPEIGSLTLTVSWSAINLESQCAHNNIRSFFSVENGLILNIKICERCHQRIENLEDYSESSSSEDDS